MKTENETKQSPVRDDNVVSFVCKDTAHTREYQRTHSERVSKTGKLPHIRQRKKIFNKFTLSDGRMRKNCIEVSKMEEKVKEKAAPGA